MVMETDETYYSNGIFYKRSCRCSGHVIWDVLAKSNENGNGFRSYIHYTINWWIQIPNDDHLKNGLNGVRAISFGLNHDSIGKCSQSRECFRFVEIHDAQYTYHQVYKVAMKLSVYSVDACTSLVLNWTK